MKTLQQLGTDLGELLEEKNAAYGNSFAKAGDFLRLLFPEGVPAARYDDALLMVRIFDKQMRIATDKDAFGESPYQDIAGYGILGVQLNQQRKESKKWPGIVSADVATQSKEQPASAVQITSAKITTSESAKTASAPSPQPENSCEQSEGASASTAMENARLSVADRLRIERNKRDCCARCNSKIDTRTSILNKFGKSIFRYCSALCILDDKTETVR